MKVLGISAYYHDSAAALVVDGSIAAAAQEERFTRKKADAGFPTQSIAACLTEARLDFADLDRIVFYDKPFLKFERLLDTYLGIVPRGFSSFRKSMPLWLSEKLFQKQNILKSLSQFGSNLKIEEKLHFAEHHQSHAGSAFYPSPFDEAVILTLDGVGEWATTSVGIGRGNCIEMRKEIHFPHSLGLLYSAVTYYLGFKVNSGEYKVMGLAPYGVPRYEKIFWDHLIDVKSDGSYRLNMKYFDYCAGTRMIKKSFENLFGKTTRKPEHLLDQDHMDIAASLQSVLETILLKLVQSLAREYNMPNLCMAGGVALNCVANGKLAKAGYFKNIWVQPASGDAGGAIGAALVGYFDAGNERPKSQSRDIMSGSYLGNSYSDLQIEKILTEIGAVFTKLPETQLIERTTEALTENKAVGWFQGRMEFGPRALGARSILADPRSETMQKQLNLKVKFRESFRPFAPSVLAEEASNWFDLEGDSPYMMFVDSVSQEHRVPMSAEQEKLFGIDKLNIKRSSVPAITHVDYSARIQTVHADTNPLYHRLIRHFFEKTGVPMLVNTSFNVRGEPIVCTPADAFRCFMGTHLDVLVIGSYFLTKENQPSAFAQEYKHLFELD